MEKLVYLIRARADADRSELRDRLVGDVAASLRAEGAHDLSVHVADDRVGISGPMPEPAGSVGVVAAVSGWFAAHDLRGGTDEILRPLGVRVDGYLVTESVWSEFGQRRGQPRDWPDGARSPGLVTLALVHRNPSLDPRTFRELWHLHQSPMSEAVQPRLRYVRHGVVHPVTPGAEPLDGIVVESWPDEATVADVVAFHNGDPGNLSVMLDSVGAAFDLSRLRSIAMSEYLLG